MASEMDTTLKNIANQVAQYVKDAAIMTVETQYVQIGGEAASFDQAHPAARTVVRLDGDSQTIVPMRAGTGGLEVDGSLYELHMRNVSAAIEYRTRILDALLGMLPTSGRRA